MSPSAEPSSDGRRSIARQGMAAAAPIAVGIIPFGLVAGAAPVEVGLGVGEAAGFSVLVFAGAAQLAAIEILGAGGSGAVAVLSALLINLRFVMYSASLAPHLAQATRGQRAVSAYVLTDQAYALSIARSTGREPLPDPRARLRYYLGAAVSFWVVWQASTLVGALVGGNIPDSIPLDFAIPLAFLALLVPAVTDRPTVVAALVGGVGTVAAAELGAGDLSLVLGASTGIVAGTVAGAGTDAEPMGTAPPEETEP